MKNKNDQKWTVKELLLSYTKDQVKKLRMQQQDDLLKQKLQEQLMNTQAQNLSQFVPGAQPQVPHTLWMAMQANIAREIIHVVPEDDYRSRVASMEENERVSAHVSADRFIISNLGSRRVITSRIPVLSEPVLLVVDASYFRYRDAQQVRQWMESAGLKSDFVVLCFSRDNLNVSDEERQQLSGFAGLFMVQSRS